MNCIKHEPNTTANATAVTVGVIYVACVITVVLLPDLSMTVAQSWFHGLDLSQISTFNVTVSSFILGLITSVGGSWLIGYIFATAYNYFAKR